MTFYTKGFDRFVTSTAAPIATGWSDSCRAGISPTEEPRLRTAHCNDRVILAVQRHELRLNWTRLVAKIPQFPGPVVGTAAGFHAHCTRGSWAKIDNTTFRSNVLLKEPLIN